MPLVDKRYAEALINLAVERDVIEAYQNELTVLSDIYGSERELRAFLLNPKNSVDTKKSMLSSLFGGKVQPDLLNLLFLLLDKGRIGFLPGIGREFIRLADEKRSILHIAIMTPIPLDQAHIDRIGERFRKLYNSSSVKATVNLDPTLIGGVKVAVGDKLYDGSVSGRLSKLQAMIAGL
jgi:F-type H+-transporting ATPase subunit delta